MKIKLIPDANTNPKSLYVVTVDTMTGDGDDDHELRIITKSSDELREIIIGISILYNAYPNGHGGYDDYCGEFYEQYVRDELYGEDDAYDSIGNFKVNYYDENGNKFTVEYTPDDDMTQKIKSFHGLTQEEITQMRLI